MILPGLWMLACLAPLASFQSLRAHVGGTLLLALLAFVPYVIACHGAFRGRGRWPILLVVGLAARLLLLFPDEGLSDDLYRYIWEGRLVLAGENPYRHAPDDPELAALRDDRIWPRVTHQQVRAAYPPISQAAFAVGAWLSPTPLCMRLLMLIVDLAVWWALAALLRARGIDPRRSVVWGWSPLVVLEVAGAAHLDVLAILCTLLALLAAARGRLLLSVLALGLATLAKPYAPVLLPFLLVRRLWPGQLAILAVTVALGYLPFSLEGPTVGGLADYVQRWEHNALLFPWVRDCIEWLSGWLPIPHAANQLARLTLLLLLGCAVLVLRRMSMSLEQKAALALAAFLLLAPTVHPWYLLWFVPLLAVRMSPALLVWSASVLLSYHVLPLYDLTGVWEENQFLLLAEYLPVLMLFAWAWIRPPGPGPELPLRACGVD